MKSIFNEHGIPMIPNLNDMGKYEPLPEFERAKVLSEIELMDTASNWNLQGNLEDAYRDLAAVYTGIYGDRIRLSGLLLTFQSAIAQMEAERKKYVERKGETEATQDLYRRNQMMMAVYKEFCAQLERNQQAILLVRHATDKLIYKSSEFEKLKKQLEDIKAAENF